MNLAIRDIRYHRGRFILTSIGLGLLLGVVLSMGGIYRGLIADALSILDATRADIWVVQQDTNGPFAESSRIQEDIKYRMALVPGVAQASPLSFQTVQIDRMGKPFRFFVIGYDLNGFGGPPIIIAGRNIRQKHYEMVVSKGMKMGIGEKIHLGLHDYTVVGITGKIVSSGGDPVAYVSLSDAQEIQFKYDNDAIRNDRERVSSWLAGIQTLSSAQAKSLKQNIAELKESTHTVNAVVVKLNPGANLTRGSGEDWALESLPCYFRRRTVKNPVQGDDRKSKDAVGSLQDHIAYYLGSHYFPYHLYLDSRQDKSHCNLETDGRAESCYYRNDPPAVAPHGGNRIRNRLYPDQTDLREIPAPHRTDSF